MKFNCSFVFLDLNESRQGFVNPAHVVRISPCNPTEKSSIKKTLIIFSDGGQYTSHLDCEVVKKILTGEIDNFKDPRSK